MNQPKSTPIEVFYPHLGGSGAYRIPSLITTREGTLIAGIDARISGMSDNPNNIDTVIRRSTDGGKTWGEPQKLVDYPGEGADGSAAIDTSLLQDEETGTIWMMFSHTPGGIGLWSSEHSIGFDEAGRRLLLDAEGNTFKLQDDGRVMDADGAATEYTVNGEGGVSFAGEPRGNIYLKRGIDPRESLLEARTSFLQLIRSDDDGLTWSKPIELNLQVKATWMGFIGTGPGRGLQLKHGRYRGRLIFPVYYTNAAVKMSCALVYSDDHGITWHRGQSPNDGRAWNGGELSAETLNIDEAQLTESQAVELPNGDIRLYMRNHSGKQRTAVAVSRDGGMTWGDVTYDETLLDSTCQSTVIAYPDLGDGKTRILFANPADTDCRRNGTVRLSEDGGITWVYSKQIEAEAYSYSCLTVLPDGRIGLLYESEFTDVIPVRAKFTTFTLDWIVSGE